MTEGEMGQSELAARRSMMSRRGIVKLASAVALTAVLPATRWANVAYAQDDRVTLTAAASEVSAAPGSAYARSAVAAAAAERGAARVEAAAALAGADREGAIAQGAAATAAAEPGAGALAQSAIAVTSASSEGGDDGGGKGRAALSYPSPRGGGGGRGGGRRVRGGGGGGRVRQRDRIASLPATGAGLTPSAPLSSLLAATSAAAALGALALRQRGERDNPSSTTSSVEEGSLA